MKNYQKVYDTENSNHEFSLAKYDFTRSIPSYGNQQPFVGNITNFESNIYPVEIHSNNRLPTAMYNQNENIISENMSVPTDLKHKNYINYESTNVCKQVGKAPRIRGLYVRSIAKVLLMNEHRKMRLTDIYEELAKMNEFCGKIDEKWKSSVRHCLSSNKCFVNEKITCESVGKGGFWFLDIRYLPHGLLDFNVEKYLKRPKKLNKRKIETDPTFYDHKILIDLVKECTYNSLFIFYPNTLTEIDHFDNTVVNKQIKVFNKEERDNSNNYEKLNASHITNTNFENTNVIELKQEYSNNLQPFYHKENINQNDYTPQVINTYKRENDINPLLVANQTHLNNSIINQNSIANSNFYSDQQQKNFNCNTYNQEDQDRLGGIIYSYHDFKKNPTNKIPISCSSKENSFNQQSSYFYGGHSMVPSANNYEEYPSCIEPSFVDNRNLNPYSTEMRDKQSLYSYNLSEPNINNDAFTYSQDQNFRPYQQNFQSQNFTAKHDMYGGDYFSYNQNFNHVDNTKRNNQKFSHFNYNLEHGNKNLEFQNEYRTY